MNPLRLPRRRVGAGMSGWSVHVWWGQELSVPCEWRWWNDFGTEAKAVVEQQRMEYYHGCPARVIQRPPRHPQAADRPGEGERE